MNDTLVRTEAISLLFGSTTVLNDVTVNVPTNQQLVVSGRSGSGKTTLLLILAGLIPPTTGMVSWPSLAQATASRRAQIGMVFQAPSLMPELTAAQNVALPLRLRGTAVASAASAAMAALAAVWADDLAGALPGQLSGGQQQRVAVARVLAGEHRLVLADEPTGALDRTHAMEVLNALRDGVASTGGSLVLATHDPELVAAFEHRWVVTDGDLHLDRAA